MKVDGASGINGGLFAGLICLTDKHRYTATGHYIRE